MFDLRPVVKKTLLQKSRFQKLITIARLCHCWALWGSEVVKCAGTHLVSETGLREEPVDGAGLLEAVPLHCQVHVTVVFDGVTVGVEKCRVPVAECLMPFRSMER